MIQDLDKLRTPDFQKKLSQCIHCGLCLQACPTYAVFGTEMDAPRGRIALMHAASEGKLELDEFQDVFTRHIQLCLACRSCETACPSGVQYGALVEEARVVVEHNRKPGAAERFLRWAGARKLMTNMGLLKFVARLMWLYEVIGLQRLVRALNFLPKTLKAMESILPPVSPRFNPVDEVLPAMGAKRGTVLFFTGCIQEGFLSPVNAATIRVLRRNGFDVFIPSEQICCGAAHLHLGEVETAKGLARQNIDAFCRHECVAVVTNAGGCGVSLKEYPHLLADDPQYAALAAGFSSKVRDIHEFLAENMIVQPRGRVEARVTYSDSCHLRHGQKIFKEPRALIKSLPGVEYVELSQPDRCCGSAGVYNIAEVDAANAILDAKMADIAATGADLIVTSNTGCHMQLIAGVRKAGLQAQVMHVVEVLDLAYQAEGAYSK